MLYCFGGEKFVVAIHSAFSSFSTVAILRRAQGLRSFDHGGMEFCFLLTFPSAFAEGLLLSRASAGSKSIPEPHRGPAHSAMQFPCERLSRPPVDVSSEPEQTHPAHRGHD